MTFSDHDVDTMWVHDFYGVQVDESVEYQISQRADHIVNLISSRVRFNRALINPRRDSYYSFSGQQRLHLLFGEANMSEYATALKVGTTCLVLTLVEMGAVPDEVRLADPLATLRSVSRDPEWRWLTQREDGRAVSAVEIQRAYLDAARRHLAGQDEETDWILREWGEVLALLEQDPMLLGDRLDWVAKRQLLETFMEAEGTHWGEDVLHSLDLEYHNIDPERGLYYGLVQEGAVRRATTDQAVESATQSPPANTRAFGRAQVLRRIVERHVRHYAVDWDSVHVGQNKRLDLHDPFRTYAREAGKFAKSLP